MKWVKFSSVMAIVFAVPLSIRAQQIEKMNFPVVVSEEFVDYPFAGGLDAPQFSQVDLNRDGLQDVFVFDRQGNTMIPFVTTFNEGVFGYEIQWDVLDSFPKMQNWVLMLDFNGDGVEDIFASTNEPGVQGIDVYRGQDIGGKLSFRKMTFDLGIFDVLYFKLGNGFTPLYAAWIDIPTIGDVDHDGDVDILSFEPNGSYLHYFKNLAVENGLGVDTFLLDWEDTCWGKFLENGFSEEIELSPSAGQCASPTNNIALQSRHSGSASAMMDVDQDGDHDLFLGDLASPLIKLLYNGGTASQAWITSEDMNFPSEDSPVEIPFFVAPFVLDINHDGTEDVVAASNNTGFSENYHVAWYYQNDGLGTNAEFHLQETALFTSEMIDVGTESKPAFFDYNSDGLMDILIGTGGYFTTEGNRDARLVLLKNIGTQNAPAFELIDDDYQNFSAFVSIPTWEFAPTSGDIDDDGDVDLLVGERNGKLIFLENTAGPGAPAIFNQPVYPYANISVGTSSTPSLIDLNGDGLLDIVCGERIGNNDNSGRCGNLNYFQNIGSEGAPQFNADPAQAPNTQCFGRLIFYTNPGFNEYSAPAFVKTPDGLRLVSGSERGEIRVYKDIENVFNGQFAVDNDNYGNIQDGERVVPALTDLDDDGYYEMMVGNRRGGLTMYNTDLRVQTSSVEKPMFDSRGPFLTPNPSGGKLMLYVDNEEFENVQYSVIIYDLSGHVVVASKMYAHGDLIQRNLESGMYLAYIFADNQRHTQKILIL